MIRPELIEEALRLGRIFAGLLPAIGMAVGPSPPWSSWTTSRPSPPCGYHLLPAVRGDLLATLGRDPEARAEFERAAALTQNSRERALLLERMAAHSPRNGG